MKYRLFLYFFFFFILKLYSQSFDLEYVYGDKIRFTFPEFKDSSFNYLYKKYQEDPKFKFKVENPNTKFVDQNTISNPPDTTDYSDPKWPQKKWYYGEGLSTSLDEAYVLATDSAKKSLEIDMAYFIFSIDVVGWFNETIEVDNIFVYTEDDKFRIKLWLRKKVIKNE